MKSKRLKPDARKEDILAAALVVSKRDGYGALTRNAVATQASISAPVLNYHFSTMPQFKRAFVRYAVRVKDLRVLAQIVVAGGSDAKAVPSELRQAALQSLS